MNLSDLHHQRDLEFSLLNAVAASVIVLDDRGRFIYTNPFFEQITGHDSTELAGTLLWTIVGGTSDRERIQKALHDGDIKEIATRVQTKQGETKSISWSFRPFSSSPENPLFVGTGCERLQPSVEDKETTQSRKKLQTIINLVPHGVYIKDAEGRFLLANNAVAEVFGKNPGDVIGRQLFDLHPNRAEAEACLKEDKEVIETGRMKDIACETVTEKNGEKRYFHTHKLPFHIRKHDRPVVLGVSVEFTDFKKKTDELKLLSRAVEQCKEGIALVDRSGMILFSNKQFAELHGMTPEKAINKHLSVFHSKKQLPSVNRALEQILSEGTFTGEIWHLKKDGTEFPTMMNNCVLRDENGEVVGMIGTLRDITASKKAEAELKQSENLYRTTVDAFPNGICVLDADLTVLFCNKRVRTWSTRLRFDPAVEGKNFFDAFSFLSKELKKEFDRIKKTGKAISLERTLDINNQKITFNVQRIPIFKENEIVRFVVLIEDITDKKRSEEAMIRTSRLEATTTLAGGIAHDFNNLMGSVLGNAELLQDKIAGNPAVEEMVRNIANGAERAGVLAQHLVAFSRGGKYDPKKIDLNQVLKDNFELQKGALPNRVSFSMNVADTLWTVKADPVQMGQILMNLCINAAEAIEGHGDVVITTKNVKITKKKPKKYPALYQGNYVCVSVKDNGCGMDRTTADKVFEPFFSTKYQGRGLGLSVVHGIVKNHDGEVILETKPGKGSTFRIFLPAVSGKAVPTVSPDQTVQRGTETVLVIDDDASVRTITAQMLTHLGYKVVLAGNGQEALTVIKEKKQPIHLALLDMGMPVMGGKEVFPLLQQHLPEMKIVICTGYEPDKNSQELLNNGAKGLLQKPFRLEALSSVIRNALDSSGGT